MQANGCYDEPTQLYKRKPFFANTIIANSLAGYVDDAHITVKKELLSEVGDQVQSTVIPNCYVRKAEITRKIEILVNVMVKYLDQEIKVMQFSQYELVLEKNGSVKIIK